MPFLKTKLAPALLSLGLIAAPVVAIGGLQPAQAQAEQYSEQQIESFAVAVVEVDRISQEWTQRLAGVDSDTEAAQMREQANAEMVQAIQSAALDVETYNQIYQSAQQDPQLAMRVEQKLQEVQQ